MDSLCHWSIRSVVHGFFHVISVASQPPFDYSLMHITFLYIASSIFWHFGPGMGRPLSCNFIHLFSSIVSFNYIRAVGSNPDSKNRGVIPCSYKATVLKGLYLVPSGKHTKNYGKSPILMGKSTISMAIFNSYVELPEGKWWTAFCCISP